MSERLEIQIDVSRARANLDALRATVTSLGTALKTLKGSGVNSIAQIAASLATFDGSKIESVATSFQRLNESLSGPGLQTIGALVAALNRVDTTKIDRAVVSLKGTEAAVQSAKTAADSMAAAFQRQAAASDIAATAATRQVSAGAQLAAQMRQQAEAAAQAAAASARLGSAGSQLATQLRQQAAAATAAATASGQYIGRVTGMAGVTQAARSSIGELGNSLTLATGQFGTFGVALQAGISSLQTLRSQGFPPGIALGVAAATVAVLALVASFTGLLKNIIDVNNRFEAFKNISESVRGSGAGAAQLQFVTDLSKSAAVNLNSLTVQFGRFDTAAKLAGQSLAESREIFSNMSGAMRVMGLDTIKTERVFTALTQIISKGQVQMEELRQQLGDSLPGAFAAMAQAANTTTANLAKMIENGEVSSKVLLKFSQVLYEQAGGANALEKAVNTVLGQMINLSSQTDILIGQFGEGINVGFMTGIAQGLRGINVAMSGLNLELFMRNLGDIAGIIAGAVLSAVTILFGALQGGMAIFNALASAAQLLVSGILSVGSAFGITGSGMAQLVTVLTTLAAGFAGITVAMRLATAASTLFGVSLMAALGPIGAFFIGVSTIIAILRQFDLTRPIVDGLVQSFRNLSSVGEATSALEKMEAVNKNLGFSQKELIDHANAVATSVSEQAAAVDAASGTMENAAVSAGNLKTAMSSLKQEQQELGHESTELGIKMSQLQQDNQAAERSAQARVQQLQRERDAYKGVGINVSDYAERIKAAQDQVKNVQNSNRGYVMALQDQQIALQRQKLDLDRSEDALKRQKDALSESGTALDSFAVKLREMAVQAGASKSEAQQLAESYKVVKAGSETLVIGLEKQVISLRKQSAEMGKQGRVFGDTVAHYAKLEAAGVKLTNSQKLIRDRAITASQGLSKLQSSLNLSAAAKEAWIIAEQSGATIGEAAQQVYARLNGEEQKRIGTVDDLAEAMSKESSETVKATAAAAKKNEETAKSTKTVTGYVTEAQDFISSLLTVGKHSADVAQGMAAVNTNLNNVNPVVATTAIGFTSLADSMGTTSAHIGTIATNLPLLGTGFTTLAPLLEPVTTNFVALGTNAPLVAEAFMSLSTQLPIVSESISGMSVLLPDFATGFENLNTALAKLDAGVTSIQNMTTALTEMSEQLPPVTTNVSELGSAVDDAATAMNDKFVPGFENGSGRAAKALNSAVRTMISDLDRLIKKIEEAIRKLDELNGKKGGGGGGGGGGLKVEGQRLGGMAGAGLTSHSVPMSTFSNAPHLSDGISNTNKLSSRTSGSGIPAILHPNEAVVPLPRGRSIPVEFNGGGTSPAVEKIAANIGSLSSSVDRFRATVTNSEGMSQARQPRALMQSDPVERIERNSAPNASTSQTVNSRETPMNITINISTPDADSFRRSEGQVRAAAYRAMKVADNRNN